MTLNGLCHHVDYLEIIKTCLPAHKLVSSVGRRRTHDERSLIDDVFSTERVSGQQRIRVFQI